MIHFLVAKLFFIFFSICYTNAYATAETSAIATTQTTTPSIACENVGNTKYLQLNKPSSKLTIFSLHEKWYLVWDLNEPITDIALPTQEEWPAGFASIEKAINIKTSKPCIVLSFKIPSEMMPMVIRTEKGWAINVVSQYLLKENPNPNQISFDYQNTECFRILNVGNASFMELDMPTGEKLNIILTDHPDTGLDPSESDYVNVYESAQGACLYVKSDQLFVEQQTDDIAYYPTKDPVLSTQGQLEDSRHYAPNLTFIKPGDFTSVFRDFLAEKAIQNKKNRPLHLLKQAWIELALGEGEEAKQTVLLLSKENPNFTGSLAYQTILGFAQFLSQDYKESIKTLTPLPNTPEINLWRDLSKSQLDEKVFFNENTISILKNYPSNLRDYILVRLIPYLFESRQIKLLKIIFQEITPKTESTQAIMAFYHAMCIFTLEDKDQGYRLLLPIAKNETPYPMPNELQAEARLETYFHDHGEDSVDAIISELDILRTQARGYDIEVKICLKLIEQLEKKKNYPKIIELIQDLLYRFKKFDVSLGFSQLLRTYLEKFFVIDNESASIVKTIGLFVRYKTIIEHYSIYETIAERIAYQYERLDLLDKAAELLTELSHKTSTKEKKIEYQLKLGNIYVQDSKPEEAIRLLSDIYSKIEGKQQEEVAKILSKAHCLKKEFHVGVQWLQRHPTQENKRTIANIYIANEDYANTANSLNDYLSTLTDKEEDNDARELGLVQLAATYHIQNNYEQLRTLYDTNKDFMQGRKSEKIFTTLCRKRAEDLKTSQEVQDYVNDADVLREIFEGARVHE